MLDGGWVDKKSTIISCLLKLPPLHSHDDAFIQKQNTDGMEIGLETGILLLGPNRWIYRSVPHPQSNCGLESPQTLASAATLPQLCLIFPPPVPLISSICY
jgi:hypothetical protein